MDDESQINSIKLKMINTFHFETEQIFREYLEGNFNIYTFKQQLNRYFDAWQSCRVDFKNFGHETNYVKILNEEPYLTIKYPQWFDNGKGSVVETKSKSFKVNIECNGNGTLFLNLKGIDFRNIYHERVPIYISYTKLIVNNSLVFNDNQNTWHDKGYHHNHSCSDKEIINVQIEFETVFDYFPKLIEFQNRISESTTLETMTKIYQEFAEFIIQQKVDLGKSIEKDTFYKEYVHLTNDFNSLLIDFNNYKKNTDKILDSYNLLFNSLFKYHELEPTKIVKYSHELNNQLLDFVDNICKKYDLKWWLDFGVLLGAVRHGKTIPWDDDYDISMLRKDYDKFFGIIKNEIKANDLERYLQVNINKKGPNNSLLSFIKLEYFDKGRLFAFVDVFPYDYITKPIEDAKPIFYNEHYKFISDLKNGMDRNAALEKYFKLFNVSQSKTDTLILGIEHFNYNQVNYDTVFPLKKIKFENRYFPCPNNSKEFLRQEYGSDFMSVPKTVYNHGFYDALSRYDDVLLVFEKHISLLKNINYNLERDLNSQ